MRSEFALNIFASPRGTQPEELRPMPRELAEGLGRFSSPSSGVSRNVDQRRRSSRKGSSSRTVRALFISPAKSHYHHD
jgi:hypothetical protein